jgi:hypothetical protein
MLRSTLLAAALVLSTVSGQFTFPFQIEVFVAEETPPAPACSSLEKILLFAHFGVSVIKNSADYYRLSEDDITMDGDVVGSFYAPGRGKISPSAAPSGSQTKSPSMEPSTRMSLKKAPKSSNTKAPTNPPTSSPTKAPKSTKTKAPSKPPTNSPTKPPAGSPPTKSPKRELRGTATSDDSRSLAVFSYKKVFSGAGAYGCKLCLRDNADRRLQVGVDMAAYDAFMSEGLSNDLNALNKLAIATILEGKPSCLGSGTIPIKAIFLSSPSY